MPGFPRKFEIPANCSPMDRHPFNPHFPTGDYTMNDEFCTRTARKIRKFGYAPKVALLYSRFFYLTMVSVSGVIITGMRRRKEVKLLGEETPRSLLRTLAGLIVSMSMTTGEGIIVAGLPVEDIIPASSRLRSN